jgi:TfoX/Sxy family transcriptional regulator of competence genes
MNGGGITAGKYKVRGKGEFSGVYDISDVFGTYAAAEAHAGAVKSSDAQVMTKGSVSLAIKAKGEGVNLGVGFSGFRIEPSGKRR